MCLKRVSVHKKECATVAYDYELFQICKNLDLGLHWAQALWTNPLAILAPFSPFSRVPFRKSKKVRDSCCLTVSQNGITALPQGQAISNGCALWPCSRDIGASD